MKWTLRIGGMVYVLLGTLTTLFFGYWGYRAANPHPGDVPQHEGVILIMVTVGILFLVTGVGLVLLRKFAILLAPLVSVLGILGSWRGAMAGNIYQVIEILVFVLILICSIVYLMHSKPKIPNASGKV